MALLILPRRSLQKPAQARLNQGHNLARGLVHYWPLLEQTPYVWPDYVSGKSTTVLGPFTNGGTPYGTGAGGYVIDARDGNGYSTEVIFAHNMGGATEFTVGALFYCGPVIPATTTIGFIAKAVSGGEAAFGCTIKPASSSGTQQTTRVAIGPAYTTYGDLPTDYIGLNAWYSIFMTGRSGAGVSIYLASWPGKRVENLSGVMSGGGPTAAWSLPSGSWDMWSFDGNGSNTGNAYAWTGVWNRWLDMAEMQALHEDPWQMLTPTAKRIWIASAASDVLFAQACL